MLESRDVSGCRFVLKAEQAFVIMALTMLLESFPLVEAPSLLLDGRRGDS